MAGARTIARCADGENNCLCLKFSILLKRIASIGRAHALEILVQGDPLAIRSRVTENRDICATVGQREQGCFFMCPAFARLRLNHSWP